MKRENPMEHRLYKTGLVAILETPEGFVSPQQIDKMRDAVRKTLVEGTNKLIVDLGRTNYINSMFVGVLVEMYTSFTNIKGHIIFAAPQPPVLQLLRTLKLDQVFEIVENVDAALARLAQRQQQVST